MRLLVVLLIAGLLWITVLPIVAAVFLIIGLAWSLLFGRRARSGRRDEGTVQIRVTIREPEHENTPAQPKG